MDCPFCLSAVRDGAAVCTTCRRDIGHLIEARARISELVARLEATPGAPAEAPPVPRAGIPTTFWLHYLATFLFWAAALADFPIDLAPVANGVTLASATLAGMFSIFAARTLRNVWMVFVAGFATPFPVSMALVVFGSVQWSDLAVVTQSEFVTGGVQLGLGASAGLVLTAWVSKDTGAALWSLAPLKQWLAESGGVAKHAETLLASTAAIGTAAAVVLTIMSRAP